MHEEALVRVLGRARFQWGGMVFDSCVDIYSAARLRVDSRNVEVLVSVYRYEMVPGICIYVCPFILS
jgi:hypothetical protein